MPEFTNTENEMVETKDGRKVWLSRSCAVAVCIVAIDPSGIKEPAVLVTKRGAKCPDFVGKWCMVCGYLDRDESSGQAAMRETWEEVGIDLQALGEDIAYQDMFDDEEQNPWHCHTAPNGQKQNVTMLHGIVLITDDPPEPSFSPEGGEVEDARWVPVSEAIDMDMCFNHDKRIAQFMRKVIKEDS